MSGTVMALGLRGWIRNRGDGSVLALIAGPEDAVTAMVKVIVISIYIRFFF